MITKFQFLSLILISSLVLAGCQLAPALPSSNSSTNSSPSPTQYPITDPTLKKFVSFLTQLPDYQAALEITQSNSKINSVLKYHTPDVYQTEFTSDAGVQTFIYQADDVYVNTMSASSWFKLPLPKADVAKKYAQLDKTSLLGIIKDMQPVASDQCQDKQCQTYQYQSSDNRVHQLVIDSQSGKLLAQTITSQDEKVVIDYTFTPQSIVIPQNAQEYILPDKPTQKDMDLLQEIYGQ